MEVYFKELISKEASLEKLVEDLERVVQGTDEFARSIGVNLAQPGTEIARRLQRMKENCQRLKLEIVAQAQATDRLVRENPYSFVSAAVVVGLLVGVRLGRRK